MSTDWYYIGRSGLLRRKKSIGPLTEAEILTRIEAGEITPETPIRSTQKTRDRWVPMQEVAPAYEHYKKVRP